MDNGSTLAGNLTVTKRADTTGGDLSVEGTLRVCREGEMVDVLSLGQPPVSHLHRQTEQSALWQIDHPLNTRFPAVRLFVENKEVFAHIVYETATDSHIDVSFVNPCVGFAILTY